MTDRSFEHPATPAGAPRLWVAPKVVALAAGAAEISVDTRPDDATQLS